MKTRLILAFSLFFLVSAHTAKGQSDTTATNAYEPVLLAQLERTLSNGRGAYSRGDYEEAFSHFVTAARWGNKPSQYLVATMLLHGQGVESSAIEAYAWLRVAVEARDPEWVRLYRELDGVLPESAMETAEHLAEIYVQRYGTEAMDMSCKRRAPTGSHVRESICTRDKVITTNGDNSFDVPVYESTVYSNTHG